MVRSFTVLRTTAGGDRFSPLMDFLDIIIPFQNSGSFPLKSHSSLEVAISAFTG